MSELDAMSNPSSKDDGKLWFSGEYHQKLYPFTSLKEFVKI